MTDKKICPFAIGIYCATDCAIYDESRGCCGLRRPMKTINYHYHNYVKDSTGGEAEC